MSNDNIGNVDDDMVEESHVRRMKKDAYYVASADGPGLILTTVHGGRGVHLNPPPVAGLYQRLTVRARATEGGRLLEAWANSASVRRGMAAIASSNGACLAEEEDNIGPIGPSHSNGPSYSNGPNCFPNLTADQCLVRKSPTRQRKEKRTQPNRTAQAPDSSDPTPTTGPTLSNDEAQRPQPSSPGPTEIPSDDGTVQQVKPDTQLAVPNHSKDSIAKPTIVYSPFSPRK
ncbi:hypothetical protein M9H77_11916 [Catharanthus roseus]|uniref:Uncharacterized protein n=1 Tax=Catharanthus roseus TaxID=4058 RepID=A0ACC0BG00_CATRO|nr:hypothetical protein M9H77_11916 [Catharanthus roseus]